jgi:hypothetical protein
MAAVTTAYDAEDRYISRGCGCGWLDPSFVGRATAQLRSQSLGARRCVGRVIRTVPPALSCLSFPGSRGSLPRSAAWVSIHLDR